MLRNLKCCHIKMVNKIQSVFNIICIFFSCGLYTIAINVFTWRITTKRVHLFSSLAQFSLIASFCVFLQKIRGASRNFLKCIYIYIYIYIIEIRNSEIYLPEVSVSSTMAPSCYEWTIHVGTWQWQYECSKPLVLYYTHCKLFVILIWKYCFLNKITFAR